MVTYELMKTLKDVHDCHLTLGWEEDMAAAARHGGKFFDGGPDQLDKVVADFRTLTEATHAAFYPDNRTGRLFDFLRDDLSVVSDGTELVSTNVTGHFMMGMPPDRAVDRNSWELHARTLTKGIGQAAGTFVNESVDDIRTHGNHDDQPLVWWDGKIAKVIPVVFGGELKVDLAMAVISIYSTVQAARRWAYVQCCASCDAASLKHRFVVLHHAVRSLQQLAARSESLGPIAVTHIHALMDSADLRSVIEPPFRRLRNGWLHLGLGDIASELPSHANVLTLVSAYTCMEIPVFTELVDRGLNQIATGIGAWLMEPGADGSTLFDHLHSLSD